MGMHSSRKLQLEHATLMELDVMNQCPWASICIGSASLYTPIVGAVPKWVLDVRQGQVAGVAAHWLIRKEVEP